MKKSEKRERATRALQLASRSFRLILSLFSLSLSPPLPLSLDLYTMQSLSFDGIYNAKSELKESVQGKSEKDRRKAQATPLLAVLSSIAKSTLPAAFLLDLDRLSAGPGKSTRHSDRAELGLQEMRARRAAARE